MRTRNPTKKLFLVKDNLELNPETGKIVLLLTKVDARSIALHPKMESHTNMNVVVGTNIGADVVKGGVLIRLMAMTNGARTSRKVKKASMALLLPNTTSTPISLEL